VKRIFSLAFTAFMECSFNVGHISIFFDTCCGVTFTDILSVYKLFHQILHLRIIIVIDLEMKKMRKAPAI